jgi:hypothetical protein
MAAGKVNDFEGYGCNYETKWMLLMALIGVRIS